MRHPRLAAGLAIAALAVLAGTALADLPSAKDQSLSTPRDVALEITLTGTATNGTADWQVDAAPSHGNLDVSSGSMTCDGSTPPACSSSTVTYTPTTGYEGADSFTFTVHSDPDGTSGDGTISIAVGSAPVANNDPDAGCATNPPVVSGQYVTLEDTPFTVAATAPCGLLANDTDADSGDTLTATLHTDGTIGSATVGAAGGFTYTPDANAHGDDSFSYDASDGDLASQATVAVHVIPVNDVPSFTGGADETVLEDSGAFSLPGWATNLSAGPTDESAQTLSFLLDSDDNASLFSVAPAVSSTGTLTFTPGANAHGVAHVAFRIRDSGGTSNGGVNTSGTQSVTITVTSVNDAPSFTAGANPTVLEDSGVFSQSTWASGITPGPKESTQTVSFVVTADDNATLFSALPAVSPAGTLTFTPAANANGVAHLTIAAKDSGNTLNGGTNVSPGTAVTITVTGVNDVPSFTAGANQTVLEDSGAFSRATWATNISAGPLETQTVNFILFSDDNPGLFSGAPSVTAAGRLKFTPAANQNGVAHVSFEIHDNGGSSNGGVDTSTAQSLTITVTAVNDPPTYTAGADPSVAEDSGAFSQAGWATNMSPGPTDEQAVQTVTGFQVTANDNPGLFSVAPAVSASGTLTFTPGVNRNGVAHVTIAAIDDGGSANGGIDISAGTAVTITVTPVNDAPTAVADAASVPENAPATTLDVLANDSSLPDAGEILTIVATPTAPSFGTLAIAPDGLSLSYKPKAGYYGPDFFTYTIQDPGGLQSTTHVDVTVVKDVTAPTVGLPVEGIPFVKTMTSTSLAGTVSWTGVDSGVGISKFELQRSVNGGAFTGVTLSTLTAKSYATAFAVGSSYQFRVRGTDKNGNVSAWKTGPRFVQARYQESSGFITYSSGWLTATNTSDSGGAAKYATVAGKTATFTHSMRDVAFVGPRSSTRGSFDVLVDGVTVGAAAMHATTTAYGQVVWSYHFAKIGTHTIQIVLRGNGRVDLDCFVILT
jgi:VCBS repeat-containing protein